eukprot:TRINITY_DN11372_c0_g1_i1.p1 TRINITY_DN11372_c0_g1~~TRINITY_DN11372_c0_g1_i1.p1  ORF type:complete len:302 (+),score=45.63 TRINITY_DN11372_c0_g1_i1:38-907(+)
MRHTDGSRLYVLSCTSIRLNILAGVTLVTYIMQLVAVASESYINVSWSQSRQYQPTGTMGIYNGNLEQIISDLSDASFSHLRATQVIAAFAMVPFTAAMVATIVNATKGSCTTFTAVAHIVASLFLLITWALEAGLYHRKLADYPDFKLADFSDLYWGFWMTVCSFVIEAVLGILTIFFRPGPSQAYVPSNTSPVPRATYVPPQLLMQPMLAAHPQQPGMHYGCTQQQYVPVTAPQHGDMQPQYMMQAYVQQPQAMIIQQQNQVTQPPGDSKMVQPVDPNQQVSIQEAE